MNKPARFTPEPTCCVAQEGHVTMADDEDGDYVEYSDYEHLYNMYNELVYRLGDLYRSAYE